MVICRVTLCRWMQSELGLCAVQWPGRSIGVRGRAPDSLCGPRCTAPPLECQLVELAQPDRAAVRGQPSTDTGGRHRGALPTGGRVVALRDGMASIRETGLPGEAVLRSLMLSCPWRAGWSPPDRHTASAVRDKV